ncbi:MAG TPA: hypothetical protein VL201_01235 [Patescibacteria group bacterium]|jgi:hypothetical protein|nr:hypothetical protein [Patescibacteria group bacterium]
MLTKKSENKKHESFVEGLMHILVKKGSCNSSEAKAIIQSFFDADAYDFDAFLVDEGLVTVARMLDALAEYYQVPFFDVVGYFFDTNLVHKFPKHIMLQHGFIPLEDDENIMVIVASDPADSNLLVEIGKYVPYDIQFRVGLHHDILDAIKEFYDSSLVQEPAQDSYDLPGDRMASESEFEEADQFFDDEEDDDTSDFA